MNNALNPAYMFQVEDNEDLEELINIAMFAKNKRETAKKITSIKSTFATGALHELVGSNNFPVEYDNKTIRVTNIDTGRFAALGQGDINKFKFIENEIKVNLEKLNKGVQNAPHTTKKDKTEYDKAYQELVNLSKLELKVIDKELQRISRGNKEVYDILKEQIAEVNNLIIRTSVKFGKKFADERESIEKISKKMDIHIYRMVMSMLDKMERKSRMM